MSPVPVSRDTVVSLRIEMYDAQGALLQASAEPVTYLHGGYGGLLEALESALEGKVPRDTLRLQLEVGMQIEDDSRIYTVTDIAAGSVVLDANHPLAGMALRFVCTVTSVRAATKEELARGVSLR